MIGKKEYTKEGAKAEEERGQGAHLLLDSSHLSIGHAPLWRRSSVPSTVPSTVPTTVLIPNRDTTNISALITAFPYITY